MCLTLLILNKEWTQNFHSELEVKDAISALFFQFNGTENFDIKSFKLDLVKDVQQSRLLIIRSLLEH
jgi:hypothetical protein